MDDGLLVRTAFDAPVRIDVERPIATIPTGARWDDVVTLAQEHGLAAAHGSSGTVGAVGYLVRGGMSFYGRQVGLAVNLVRSISVVLAEGKLVRATANEHADLFWALRGGDGGFGVVTQIEVSLFPMAQVITGGIFWSAEYAEPILDRWQQWCRTAPERASTSMRLLNLPPLPGIPDQIAGRPVIGLDGAVSVPQESDPASGLRILDQMLPPLRAVAEPLLDTWAPKRLAELLLTHLDPPQPLIYQNDHFLLADLSVATGSRPWSRWPARPRARICSSSSCVSWAVPSPQAAPTAVWWTIWTRRMRTWRWASRRRSPHRGRGPAPPDAAGT
jgi:FAD binding domain